MTKELGIILTDMKKNKITPYPKTLETLKKLKKNFKLGVISNAYEPKIFSAINREYKISDLFDYIVLSYEVEMLKPDPRIFDFILKKLQVKKEETVMIGDTLEDDVKAAENAGIKGILFDVKNKHPDYPKRILSLDEIYKYLE
ncbi:MAG: HAD family hydrolase [Candidatus Aenigmatarchaeota archaeon]